MDPTHSSKILFLLVNYFNENETCSFIREQLCHQDLKRVDVVIADNGSHDTGKLQHLQDEIPWVHLVAPPGNPGYLPGAAFALESYLQQGFGLPDLVILSNSDIAFADSGFLDRLVSGDETAAFDIIGPDIFSGFLHRHQNPFMRERITMRKLGMLAFLSSNPLLYSVFLTWYYGKSWMKGRFRKEKERSRSVMPVYGVHGSFMIFRKSYFEKGGNFNYPLPLFGEEIYIAELALASGMLTGYDPSLKVIHHEHSTTGIYKSRNTIRQMNRSYNYLLHHRKGSLKPARPS